MKGATSFLLFLYLLLSVSNSGCYATTIGKTPPTAKNGILDLRGWDFEKDGIVRLDGDWALHWQKLLAPDAIPDSGEKRDFINLPNHWNGYQLDGEKLPGIGFATFRLTILSDRTPDVLGFKLREFFTSYAFFVNGELVSRAGVVGKSKQSVIPASRPRVAEVRSSGNRHELVLHVANFHYHRGGPIRDIQLGSAIQIKQLAKNQLLLEIFLFGSIMMMGLYHLGLFIIRRKDRSPLLFGIICLIISFRLLMTGETYFMEIFPEMGFEMMVRLIHLAFYAAVPVFLLFIRSLFPEEFSQKVLALFLPLAAGVALVVLITPAVVHSHLMKPYQLATLAAFIYSVAIVVLAVKRKREGAAILLTGVLVLFVIAANDILYNNNIIQTGYFAPFGLFVFIFSQAFLLSKKFSMAFSLVEAQTHELKRANQAFVNEIAARKKAERLKIERDAATAANLAKSEFLANMSHEIRTPMNAIMGFAEIVNKKITDTASKQHLSAIISGGKTLLRIINDVLDFSRIEAGKLDIQPGTTNIRNTLREVEQLFSFKAGEKGLKLSFDVASSVPEQLILDEARISQVLFNLVGNALKFTDSGTIEVTVRAEEENPAVGSITLVIRVTDTGIGIHEDQLNRIFSAFEQSPGQPFRKYGGTGLGLAITRKLAEIMEGSIRVESAPGSGSCFTVRLPVAVVGSPKKELTESIDLDAIVFLEATILIADDVAENRDLIRGYLENQQALNLIEADNGRMALNRLEKHRTELILMDMKMPVLSGYEAVHAIRQDERLKSIPVVAVSATVMPDEENQVKQLGCADFIRKPFSRKDLYRCLLKYLPFDMIERAGSVCDFAEEVTGSIGDLGSWEALLEHLSSETETELKRLRERMIMDEIAAFAAAMMVCGREYRWQALSDWGQTLNTLSERFDTENLNKHLDGFPSLVRHLSKTIETQKRDVL